MCGLFLDFLSENPPEFRKALPFLKKGSTELQWAAADGGVAFAAFFEENRPVSMGVLISGLSTYWVVKKFLRMRVDDLY